MADGVPPPLPPKQKASATGGGNVNNNGFYPKNFSKEDMDRALQEEKLAYQRIKEQQMKGARSIRAGKIFILRWHHLLATL